MKTRQRIGRLVLAATCATALGCGSDAKPPPLAPTTAVTAPATAAPQRTDSASRGSIRVDDAIAKACDLPTPRFDFDSARIDGDAARSLDKLAQCFVSGALRGKNMRLVGHSDPRGELDYNFALGQRRAGGVGDYLTSHGISVGRISTSSRGELDVVGTDPDGWQRDRRVDITLAN